MERIWERDPPYFECHSCGDHGTREERGDLGSVVVTHQGYECHVSLGTCWSYAGDGEHISEWFNIHDVSHVAALEHLEEHGRWPEGFLPPGIRCGYKWKEGINHAMAKAWERMILKFKPQT